jgi:hypothetical protein
VGFELWVSGLALLIEGQKHFCKMLILVTKAEVCDARDDAMKN